MAFGDPFQDIPGLLSPEANSNVRSQMLLQAASGLLGASGWQKTPTSLGSIAGAGINGALQGQNEGMQMAMKQRLLPAQLQHLLQSGRGGADGLTADIKEYEYAKKSGFEGSFTDWMTRKKVGADQYGLEVQWGKRKNPVTGEEEDVPLQFNRSGEATSTKLPDGVRAVPPGLKATNVGTEIVYTDRSGAVVGREKVDVAGKAAATVAGTEGEKARIALPTIISSGDEMLGQIEKVLAHPAKAASTGPIMGRVPGIAGKQLDFVERVDQLKGGTFLQAYQNWLKGGGPITDIEGQKGTEALARLNRAKNQEDFDGALIDLKNVIHTGVGNARAKAKVGAGQGSMVGAPGERLLDSSGGWQTLPSGNRVRQVK